MSKLFCIALSFGDTTVPIDAAHAGGNARAVCTDAPQKSESSVRLLRSV